MLVALPAFSPAIHGGRPLSMKEVFNDLEPKCTLPMRQQPKI
jgi:hypothetical protein